MSEPQPPELKDYPAARVIALEHRGSYDEIGSVYRKLTEWARQNGVTVSGKGRTVFLDSPSRIVPESARYMVCLPVSGTVKAAAGVQVKDLPAQKVYAYVHKGPYSQIPARYTELMAWAAASQCEVAGPPFEVYVKHPDPAGRTDASEYVTEICLPVNA